MVGSRKVAIVGAGVSGLVAIKSCLEEGLEPMCFEQFSNIGGQWYNTEQYREGQGARLFDGLTTNTSKDMMALSDFPFDPELPPYNNPDVIHDYLQKYCSNFGLLKYIHLNTKVVKISKTSDYNVTGKWDVVTEGPSKMKQETTYDFVMICSGNYTRGRIPDIAGLDKFEGTTEHSQTFKNAAKFANKRVLIVGNSHTAGDVSVAVSARAKQTYLGIGPGTWIYPKLCHRGQPLDCYLFRRRNKNAEKMLFELANGRLDHFRAGVSPTTSPLQSRFMINDIIQCKIQTGEVKIAGKLVRLTEHDAVFEDGTVIKDVDSIIFATGNDAVLAFVDDKKVAFKGGEKVFRYKMIFPMGLSHNTVALIGFTETDGPLNPVAELQSRIAARVFAGRLQLPSRDAMMADIERLNAFVVARTGRFKYLFQNLVFRDELAEVLGVTPSWWDLLKAGPVLAYDYYYGPAFPFFYRMWGPHSWSGAQAAVENAKKNAFYGKQVRKPLADSFVYRSWTASTVLYPLLALVVAVLVLKLYNM